MAVAWALTVDEDGIVVVVRLRRRTSVVFLVRLLLLVARSRDRGKCKN